MKDLFIITLLLMFCISCVDEKTESSNDPVKEVVVDIEVGEEPSGDLGPGDEKPPVEPPVEPDTEYQVNLEGVIDGNSWSLIKGRVIRSKWFVGKYSFDFWDEDVANECYEYTFGGARNLMGSFPLKTGTVKFGNMDNMTFFYRNNNLIATDGYIEITEITEEYVRGNLKAEYNSNNTVSGSFELTFCK
jgi:hypothetical protein